jgi:hypothetical protein
LILKTAGEDFSWRDREGLLGSATRRLKAGLLKYGSRKTAGEGFSWVDREGL